ncbi:MAG: 6,7-dimethyl-8-ribityllumazine synthase [Chitinophagaceae bacterium]
MTDHSVNEINSINNNLQVPASQVVLVSTQWNKAIIDELERGAMAVFANFPQIKVSSFKVPGAVEIPHAIHQHHRLVGADAYIALGCVIRGETPHFDYVCQSVTQGITQLNVQQDAPVIFGVLTVNTLQQAHDRLGGKDGHKGEEAAMAALNMLALQHHFQHSNQNTQP